MILVGLLLLVMAGLIALGARAWRNREQRDEDGGLDLIPYLLMALAVGVAGFSLAGLARASLTPDRLAGRPIGEIAGSLAGLVVAAPVAYLLWRRQARRRRAHPQTPAWPIYVAVVELVFLTAFLAAVAQVAEAITEDFPADWPDLLVFGGIVGFHWLAERREPGGADIGELPRVMGSGVALVALVIGLIGTLSWLFAEAYESMWGLTRVPDPAAPLALTLAAGPIWAWRWLPEREPESNVFRNLYLALVTALTLILAVAAGVTLVATLLSFLIGDAGPDLLRPRRAQDHFRIYPQALAFALTGGGLWYHHMRRFVPARESDRRGYEYTMAAAGLGALVGSTTALVDAVFAPTLTGSNISELLVTLGCTVIASGWVWFWFWRKAQAAPRRTEVGALPRRIYLIGMAIVTGLTGAGALIGALVVVFQALLGEQAATADRLRIPLILSATAGLAFWHLFTHVRADAALRRRTEARPFTITVICSHPGDLATMFPGEATVRVLYRADAAGIIDDEMAVAIVAAVDGSSSLVWVDDGGFRVAAARET